MPSMLKAVTVFLCLALLSCAPSVDAPFSEPAQSPPVVMSKVVALTSTRRETIPVHLYYPATSAAPLPVVLFSTGALSSPEKYEALLRPWAEAGYGVVAPLHVDSERWTGARPANPTDGLAWRWLDMMRAAEGEATLEEVAGVDFDFSQVAATGHSFGGLLAQVLGGARPGPVAGDVGPETPFTVSAVIAISPPGPIPSYIEPSGWAQMSVPQLLTTGDKDVVQGLVPQWSGHLAGHDAHPGASWALVQSGVDHYFGNVIGRTEYPGPPQQAQFDAMTAESLTFLAAFLGGDIAARRSLEEVPQEPSTKLGLKRR